MPTTATRPEIEKIAELVKDIRTAMFITIDAHGAFHGRPMSTQHTAFDGTLWFFTGEHSRKVREIAANPRVCVSYAATSDESYLSVTGRAAVVDDRSMAKELWNPFLRAWFTGPDDPSLRLVRVDAEEAEYWESKGGKIASMIMVLKAAITGDQDREMNNEHARVKL